MPAADEPIVVNTGPVIALEACGQLSLLRAFHSRVIMPADVAVELTRGATRGAGGPRWPSSTEGIEVLATAVPPPPLLAAQLDPGEAAVIALALEHGISLVLIDERRGRMVARILGLRVTGSVGILLRGKKEGRVPSLRQCIDQMRARGVWLSEHLCDAALREAGEDTP
jgi:predicted nucleic acid-binding protein